MRPKKIILLKSLLFLGFSLLVLAIAISGVRPKSSKSNGYTDSIPTTFTTHSKVSLRDSLVEFGMKYLGTPYVYGACGKDGFDCSGFVYFVYQQFHIKVPRSSIDYSNVGSDVSFDQLRKGDILLFLSPTRNVVGHVGIVSHAKGNESDFIHASSGGAMNVMISSLKQEHYKRRFVKAINVLGD